MKKMDATFWNEHYESNHTPWDLNSVSTPLKEYIDQLTNKNLRILIPGAGNGYEAEYLHQLGFKHVYVVDFVQTVLYDFAARNPDFPKEHLICSDFFELKGQFDLILEQTFFCAIDPALRSNYGLKMNELLVDEGKLVGVLFNRSFEGGPPFGGNEEEYRNYFKDMFSETVMEPCYNSILPRLGSELFIQLKK